MVGVKASKSSLTQHNKEHTHTEQSQTMTTTTVVSKDSNPVQAAANLSKRAGQDKIDKVSLELKQATALREKICRLQSELLPIENELRPRLASDRTKLESKIKRLTSLLKLEKYPLFSLEPLTWRDEDGFPRLTVFSTQNKNFCLTVNYARPGGGNSIDDRMNMTPRLPPEIQKCYQDVFEKLSKISDKTKKTVCIQALFKMLIPKEVRELIRKAEAEFENIYIITESPPWDVTLTEPPVVEEKDPLVVGYDGVNYWLIAVFDPTQLEKYIEDEFCV